MVRLEKKKCESEPVRRRESEEVFQKTSVGKTTVNFGVKGLRTMA